MKSIFKSKTIWINVLMSASMILPSIANLPSLQVAPEIMGLVLVVVNTVLRLVTKDSLKIK